MLGVKYMVRSADVFCPICQLGRQKWRLRRSGRTASRRWVWSIGRHQNYSDNDATFGHSALMRTNQLEGLARSSLLEIASSSPPDAFVLADSFSLVLTPVCAVDEGMVGREIRFGGRLPAREQQEFVVRCVALWLLQRAGYCPTQHSIARLARALMMPWDRFIEDMRATRSFSELRLRYPHASDPMLGARCADVEAARSGRVRMLSVPSRASSRVSRARSAHRAGAA